MFKITLKTGFYVNVIDQAEPVPLSDEIEIEARSFTVDDIGVKFSAMSGGRNGVEKITHFFPLDQVLRVEPVERGNRD